MDAAAKPKGKPGPKPKSERAAALLVELKKHVVSEGGKENLVKGYKVAPAPSSSPAKGGKKSGALGFLAPDGKWLDSPQAVIKHLGLGGLQREDAYARAQAYRHENPCPFTLKVQQGFVTVQQLGNLMVEKGPAEPTFHDDSNLYPIGFKAEFRDPVAGTVFENSVMDGMDVFNEDVPAFQVKVLGDSAVTLVEKRPQSVWKLVKQHLEEKGTDKEKEVAKSWNLVGLSYKFGLGHKEVRRRIEGLSGAIDCFKYKFVDEAEGAGSKNKKAKTAKGSAFVGKGPEQEARDDKARKMGGGARARRKGRHLRSPRRAPRR